MATQFSNVAHNTTLATAAEKTTSSSTTVAGVKLGRKKLTEAVLLERAAEEAKLLKLTTKLAKQAKIQDDKLKERQAKKAKINN